MYIAAVRIADEFGCESIGIQYQQGFEAIWLRRRTSSKDLLNNAERPPVFAEGTTEELYAGVVRWCTSTR